MKTSEQLDRIAGALRAERSNLKALAVGLPGGRTLELVWYVETRLASTIESLHAEAAVLRRGSD